MFKRFLSALLVAILLLSGTSFAYDDIPADASYLRKVDYLKDLGVFPETNNFQPNLIINKIEFIKYLVLMEGNNLNEQRSVSLPFSDTSNNAWYAPYVQEALQVGILSDRDEKLEPYKKLTLIDALELLFHSYHIPIPKRWDGGKIPYTDVAKNTRVAPMIMQALNFGIIEPTKDDYVGIYQRITRSKAAEMIYNMTLINLAANRSTTKDAIQTLNQDLQKFISAWNLVEGNYVKETELDFNAMSEAAIKAMVGEVDDAYTAYMDRKQNSAFSDDLDGEIEGIGAYIGTNDDKEVTIISPISGSPAEKAGIKSGDIVRKVDGTDVAGMTLYEVVNLIKGPKGTSVKLTVERSGKQVMITVIRDTIVIHAIKTEMEGNIMVIKLSTFSHKAAQEFLEAVQVIQANPKIKGIIIDLRDNPGGLLNAATAILNHLLRKDTEVLNVEYNYLSYTQYSNGPGELVDYPMAVIINKGSASASEIVAGALKDYNVATIVGETSFGKGSVQEVNYFTDGSSLKLTVAKWLTPLKHSIQENGITPDVEVKDNPNTNNDEVLIRAIKEVKKRMQGTHSRI